MRSYAPVVSLALAGCASLLGLRDIEEGDAPISGSASDASTAGNDGSSVSAVDGSSTSSGASEAGVVAIDCLGQPVPAFYCEGFETAGATLPEAWTVQTAGDADTGFVQKPDVSLAPSKQRGQAHTGQTGPFKVTATWARPAPGPLAFQITLQLPHDAWSSGDKIGIAALTTSEGKRVEVQFVASGSSSNGALQVAYGTEPPLPLGAIEEDTWQCIEVVADGSSVTAYRGQNKVDGSISNVGLVTRAELGIPSTPLATKDVFYDDIVLAPARVGCISNK